MKLVIEYHYEDGDIGAYEAGTLAEELWRGFTNVAGAPEPSHIIIRPAKEGE